MASLRTQTPAEHSRIQALKIPMRELRLAHRPYVLTIPDEAGTHFKVTIGRSKNRTVTGLAWKDGSFFRANFDLPPWAKDAAPPKDSNTIYVFKHGGGKAMGAGDEETSAGSFTGVRIRVQDLAEFIAIFGKMVDELVSIARGNRAKVRAANQEEKEASGSMQDEAAFPIVGVPINEDVTYEDAYTEEIDYNANGRGEYLAVRTSGSQKQAIIEMMGPIPAGRSKIDSLHLREGWQPIVKVMANDRQEALSQAAQYFSNKGFDTQRTYGTLRVQHPGMLAEGSCCGDKDGAKNYDDAMIVSKVSGVIGNGKDTVEDIKKKTGVDVKKYPALFKMVGSYPVLTDHAVKLSKALSSKRKADGAAMGMKHNESVDNAKPEEDGKNNPRPINVIAREIKRLWKKPNYAARPYLDAMLDIRTIDDVVLTENGWDIVNRFLGNASSWRGEDAKRIKAELKAMLGDRR